MCYKCNKFVKNDLSEPNDVDFKITVEGEPGLTDGIAYHQGVKITGETYAPVGNMFDPNPVTSHYDFYNECNAIMYHYPSGVNWTPYRLIPSQAHIYSITPFTPQMEQGDFSQDKCPSTLGGGGSWGDMVILEEATIESDSLSSLLNSLVDGGSTSSLNYEVASSIPPDALQTRGELLSKSPYLSDTVMKTSITKEDVLDNAMIRDILVANPQSAKSDEIIIMLENRSVPVPDYMMEQILAGGDSLGAKEILELKRAYWEAEGTKAYQRLIYHYKEDTINPSNEDSLTWLFIHRNTLESFYDCALWYHQKGQYYQRDGILAQIPSVFSLTPCQQSDYQGYLDFIQISEDIVTDSIHPFGIDSTNALALRNLASENIGLPGAYARNMLISAGMVNYQEPIILSDTTLKSSKKQKKNKFRGIDTPSGVSRLKIYPNPTSDYFIVEYHLDSSPEQGSLSLLDIFGTKVGSYLINGKENQVIIPVKNLKPGMYFVILNVDEKSLESAKINVIP